MADRDEATMSFARPPYEQALRPPTPRAGIEGMAHDRLNRGFLAEPERRVLLWLAARTPVSIRPDHLTAVGVGGALLVLIGFGCAHYSPYFVILAIVGLLINWLGDSLDGTLARYRKIERPRIGYFIDHSCDLISQTFIFIGLGVSPYFTLFAGLLALSMYLLMSSYTYLKVMILRTHQLSYGGMGATELRLAICCWAVIAVSVGPELITTEFMRYPVLDDVIGGLWIAIFIGFIAMVRSDLSKFRDEFCEDEPGHVSADRQR